MNARPYPRSIVETCADCFACAWRSCPGFEGLCPRFVAEIGSYPTKEPRADRERVAGADGLRLRCSTEVPEAAGRGQDRREPHNSAGRRGSAEGGPPTPAAAAKHDMRSGRALYLIEHLPRAALAELLADVPELLELRRIYEQSAALGVRLHAAREG